MSTQPLPEPPPSNDIKAVLAWAKAENDRTEKVLDGIRAYLDGSDKK